MQITFASMLWMALALLSVFGLYHFNKGVGIFNFITERKFLILFISAGLLGMRNEHLFASVLVGLILFWMLREYPPYLERCRNLKHTHHPKHH